MNGKEKSLNRLTRTFRKILKDDKKERKKYETRKEKKRKRYM
jgi:hypothetical protein